ncbi:MAG: alpha/beta hydrolase, partial [Acidobacteriota bacterium]
PVLLLHGNPDSARLWDGVVPHLTGYPCVMPDLPGFGRSKIVGDYAFTLDAHVEWLDAALDGVGIRGPVHLVVHDFGGPFGLAWAVRNPERVASVLLSDTIFMSQYRWHFWARLWRTRMLGDISMPLMGWPIFRWELRRGSKHLPDEHIRRTWELVTPAVKRTVLKLYRATEPEVFLGWEDELRRLLAERPSLALWGADDPYIDASWAHRLGARNVEVVRVADIGYRRRPPISSQIASSSWSRPASLGGWILIFSTTILTAISTAISTRPSCPRMSAKRSDATWKRSSRSSLRRPSTRSARAAWSCRRRKVSAMPT